MKTKILIYAFFLLVLASFAFAEDEQVGDVSDEGSLCSYRLQSTTAADLLEEIPDINAYLSGCPVKIPKGANFLVGKGIISVNVAMKDGTTKSFLAEIQGKKFVSVIMSGDKGKYYANIDEESLDSILQAGDKMGTAMTLYKEKKIKFGANSFFPKLKLFFVKPLAGLFIK